ncbi:MAG: MipA/OmpV family protein [Rhodocyclaceae bacterium]
MLAISLTAYASRNRAMRPIRAAMLAVALIGSASVQGAEPSPKNDQETTWGLGVGAGSKQKPYAGIGRDNEVLPLIEFENKYVHVLGPAVEAKLPSLVISDAQKINFRLVGRYAIFGGYEADDAPILAGMDERKDGFWAGAKVEWKNSLANVNAEWLRDMSGYSKGQRFSLGLDRNWRFGKQYMLVPRVVATWHDGKYNDFYFGVRDFEARPGRPAYRAGSGVSAEVGLRGIYMYDRHHSVFADVMVSSLSSTVKDSPLVDRSTETRFFLAYVYRF